MVAIFNCCYFYLWLSHNAWNRSVCSWLKWPVCSTRVMIEAPCFSSLLHREHHFLLISILSPQTKCTSSEFISRGTTEQHVLKKWVAMLKCFLRKVKPLYAPPHKKRMGPGWCCCGSRIIGQIESMVTAVLSWTLTLTPLDCILLKIDFFLILQSRNKHRYRFHA